MYQAGTLSGNPLAMVAGIKTLEILEVLDYVIHGSLASGFVVTLLQVLLDQAIEREGTTYEAVVALASWRSELA